MAGTSTDGEPDPKPLTDAVKARSPALAKLVTNCYSSLLEMARRIHAGRAASESLSPTALVHEAFLRLVDQSRVTSKDSVFFRACFAQECRRALVDHARHRFAQRRGGRDRGIRITDSGIASKEDPDLLHLNDAIEALAKLNPRMAQVVDLRIFGGLTIAECAAKLNLSRRTIDKELALGRAWLQRELEP